MELSSPIYGAFTFFSLFLFCYFLISTSAHRRRRRLPPQPAGAHPLMGHLHLMGGLLGDDLPHIKFSTIADQLGPIFTIRLGKHRAVVVSSWKIAKQLFTNCDVAVSSRPKLRATQLMSYDFAMFGFSPYGPYWREMRKLIAVELLSRRRVELLGDVCLSEIALSVKELCTQWEEGKKDGSGRVLVDLKKWFEELNMNLILKIVAGKRIAGDEMRRLEEVKRDFFSLAGTFVPADAVPWLRWLDLGGYEKSMKETAKEFDRIVGKWVEEHRRMEDSGEDKKYFIDVMLSAVGSLDFGGEYDTDTIIKSTCQAMVLAGSDTSSIVLTWAVCLLLNHRHVLIKAQEELDKHVGRGRMVQESDIHNLVYLQCIIKESLRLYTSNPLVPTREFTEDCDIDGYHIPKGTWLIINLWKLQRDPEVWVDSPLEFKPERFLSTQKNVNFKGYDFELIPFGAGRRICPGLNLATLVLHLALANFLQAFDVDTVSDESIDMTACAGMTNCKATPLEVLIAPRKNSNHY